MALMLIWDFDHSMGLRFKSSPNSNMEDSSCLASGTGLSCLKPQCMHIRINLSSAALVVLASVTPLPRSCPSDLSMVAVAGVQRAGLQSSVGPRGSRRGSSAVAHVAPPEQQAEMAAADFIRPHLLKLKPYTPIEPFEILAQRLGREAKDIVKLDANENPYGPPPEVLAALGSMPFPNIYPDPESRRLREALSKWHSVPSEHLLVRALHADCPASPSARGRKLASAATHMDTGDGTPSPALRFQATCHSTLLPLPVNPPTCHHQTCCHAGRLRRRRAHRPADAVRARCRRQDCGLPAHIHHVRL